MSAPDTRPWTPLTTGDPGHLSREDSLLAQAQHACGPVTLGRGLRNPLGWRQSLHGLTGLSDLLARHIGDEAWWSPSLFRGDHRRAAGWESATAVAVDVDHLDAAGTHAALPPARADQVLEAGPPGNLAHATPRGLRLILVLTQLTTDPQAWTLAARGACEMVRTWLGTAGREGCLGLRVDTAASCDRARLFFTPRATVGGQEREAEVRVLRETPYDVAELAAASPSAPPPTGAAPPEDPGDLRAELKEAERYARAAVARAVAKIRETPEGQRNETLNAEAFSLAGLPGVDAEPALQALIGAAMTAGLPEAEAARTARSGWAAGEKRPRRAPPPPGVSQVSQVSQVARTSLLPFTPLPLHALPRALCDLATHGARSLAVDPAGIATLGLGVLAGTIGNAASLQVKADWTVPAVLWTVLVARSGSRKSPVLRLLLAPLHDLERQAARRYRAEVRAWKKDLAAWKRRSRKTRGADPEPPAARVRFIVGDTTVEKLGVTLDENPRGLLVERDELRAWFGSFDAYKASGRGSDEAHWLSMYDAGPLLIDRISRESLYIPHAAVSIAGAVQPGVLRTCLTGERHASGMVARLTMVAPPERPGAWEAPSVPGAVLAAWGRVLTALRALPVATDADGDIVPRPLSLAPSARDLFGAFVTRTRRAILDAPDELAARLSKSEGVAARLALVIALAEDPEAREVGADAVRRAIELAEWFAAEAGRVQHAMAHPEVERRRRELQAWVRRRGGRVSVREVQREGPGHLRRRAESARDALDSLVAAGVGRWEDAADSASRVFVLCDTCDTCDSGAGPSPVEPDSSGLEGSAAARDPSQARATVATVDGGPPPDGSDRGPPDDPPGWGSK